MNINALLYGIHGNGLEAHETTNTRWAVVEATFIFIRTFLRCESRELCSIF